MNSALQSLPSIARRGHPVAPCLLLSWWIALASGLAAGSATTDSLPDVYSQDVSRFAGLLTSPVPERRVEGVQGLSYLKCWAAEESMLALVEDPSPIVRRETVQALGRLGTAASVPQLIRLLDDPSWELRQNAWLALCRITGQDMPANQPRAWHSWWRDAGAHREREILERLAAGQGGEGRRASVRALRHLATPASETYVISLLTTPRQPPWDAEERAFLAEALERIGTRRSVPVLAAMYSEATAWALGRIGGPEAEAALMQFPKTLPVLLNLDRLRSTNCASLIPYLVQSMGLVTYRGQPDDLMNVDPQPIQRVAANLILRSGQEPLLTEWVVRELERTLQPPVPREGPPAVPAAWRPMFESMREELKPGFVRGDGLTTSQPLAALYFSATNRDLAPRLVPLLRHPAFVPRVYVAMLLGRLGAAEALPEMLRIIREGYAFSDATALASGKHFDQSQTVRWRGFLCMALGRMGGDAACRALEELASDPGQPRDIRYGAVVGLGFIKSPASVPVLRTIAEKDVIWMVRDEARRSADSIALLAKEVKP